MKALGISMIKSVNFENLEVDSSEELRSWLLKNHKQTNIVWLVTFKKNVPDKYVSTSQDLDKLIVPDDLSEAPFNS